MQYVQQLQNDCIEQYTKSFKLRSIIMHINTKIRSYRIAKILRVKLFVDFMYVEYP